VLDAKGGHLAVCRWISASGVPSAGIIGLRERPEGAREHHDVSGKGAGRQPRARLVRSREAQPHRRRAQRAAFIILAAIV